MSQTLQASKSEAPLLLQYGSQQIGRKHRLKNIKYCTSLIIDNQNTIKKPEKQLKKIKYIRSSISFDKATLKVLLAASQMNLAISRIPKFRYHAKYESRLKYFKYLQEMIVIFSRRQTYDYQLFPHGKYYGNQKQILISITHLGSLNEESAEQFYYNLLRQRKQLYFDIDFGDGLNNKKVLLKKYLQNYLGQFTSFSLRSGLYCDWQLKALQRMKNLKKLTISLLIFDLATLHENMMEFSHYSYLQSLSLILSPIENTSFYFLQNAKFPLSLQSLALKIYLYSNDTKYTSHGRLQNSFDKFISSIYEVKQLKYFNLELTTTTTYNSDILSVMSIMRSKFAELLNILDFVQHKSFSSTINSKKQNDEEFWRKLSKVSSQLSNFELDIRYPYLNLDFLYDNKIMSKPASPLGLLTPNKLALEINYKESSIENFFNLLDAKKLIQCKIRADSLSCSQISKLYSSILAKFTCITDLKVYISLPQNSTFNEVFELLQNIQIAIKGMEKINDLYLCHLLDSFSAKYQFNNEQSEQLKQILKQTVQKKFFLEQFTFYILKINFMRYGYNAKEQFSISQF